MATLDQRLRALEATQAHRRKLDDQAGAAWSAALNACFRSLMDALPNDETRYIQYPHSRQFDFIGWQSSSDKCEALAQRIKTGELNEDDQRALDSLPDDALKVMGRTAGEFVMWIQAVSDSV